VSGVRENIWNLVGLKAAPAHPQFHKALRLRGVRQGVYAILEPVPPQAHARHLSDADQVLPIPRLPTQKKLNYPGQSSSAAHKEKLLTWESSLPFAAILHTLKINF